MGQKPTNAYKKAKKTLTIMRSTRATKRKVETTSTSHPTSDTKHNIATEEENREVSNTINELDSESKDLNESLANHEEDINDLNAIDPELSEAIRIFFNQIKQAQLNTKKKLKKKIVIDTFHQVKEYLTDAKTPKTYFEIIHLKAYNDPMLEEALNNFGIKKLYFLHLARTDPDRMFLEADTIADRIGDGRRNAIGNAQNAGDPKYIAELKERYNIREPDEKINKLDLIMRGFQDEDMSGIPAAEAVQKIRDNFREAKEESNKLAGTVYNLRTIHEAILAEQHQMLIDAKAEAKKALEEKDSAEDSKATTEEQEEATKASIKALEASKTLIEADLTALDKLKKSVFNEIEEEKKQRDYIRTTNLRELENAQERLRNIEAQIRQASERLAIASRRQGEGRTESNGVEPYEPRNRAVPRTDKQEPQTKPLQVNTRNEKDEASSNEELEPKVGWYRLALGGVYKDSTGKVLKTDGKYVRKYEEKNGGRMVMNHNKMGGKMAEVEFIKLRRAGKVLDLDEQAIIQNPKDQKKEEDRSNIGSDDIDDWEKDLAELDLGKSDLNAD